jgi:hypothetical protein
MGIFNSDQILLSVSCEKLSILTYRDMPVFLCDCEIWSFALMELCVGEDVQEQVF